ncbi:HAD-IIA family hydrolase [Halobacteria archaeon AArc-curdl1]|uniref:HAD-IIA family hydrolase n=1 Tax=Natronosalvus hydrolyticus TaxID=2979988 RepID=A0AAP2Z6Y1_9EURY|nr:HAD-IIA family hydrolase [Halobacteria archaeon AArc-curdl1]
MSAYEAVILDVDGTLVRGERVLPGAVDGLRAIDDTGCQRLLFSNNPTRGGDHYAERLGKHDISVDPEFVLTSASVSVGYLSATHPDDSIYLVGEDRLRELLEAASLEVTDDPASAGVVLGSIDRALTYDQLSASLGALEVADAFYGTDPDVTIPTENGFQPGSGAIIAAMEAIAGWKVDAILGKPSSIAAATALQRLETAPERTLIVGDRPDTDIELGARAGMDTALVTTGVTSSEQAATGELSVEPDYVLESLAELEAVLTGNDRDK